MLTVKEFWEKFNSLDELDQRGFFAYLRGYLGDEKFNEIMDDFLKTLE